MAPPERACLVERQSSAHYASLLRRRIPFVFTRWGDGEWEAILRGEGENCDGHRYWPEMNRALRDIVLSRPDYYMGLLKIARRTYDQEIAALVPGYRWADGDALLEDFLAFKAGEFLAELRKRALVYVGPARLRALEKRLTIPAWVETPLKNAWTVYPQVLRETLTGVRTVDTVGLSCGPMAKVLAHELHASHPSLTIIDFGSMFDGMCGYETRSYHKGRDWFALGKQL